MSARSRNATKRSRSPSASTSIHAGCRTAPASSAMPGFGGRVDEARRVVAIQPQHGCAVPARRPARSPTSRSGSPSASKSPQAAARVGRASATPAGGGDVGERRRVVAIQPVGRAVEADEQIDVAVAVVVRRRVHERAAGREEIRLDRLEHRRRRREEGQGEKSSEVRGFHFAGFDGSSRNSAGDSARRVNRARRTAPLK